MGCVYLLGQDSETWNKYDLNDLVALRPRQSDGLFSAWVTDSVVHTYHRILGRYFRVTTLVSQGVLDRALTKV